MERYSGKHMGDRASRKRKKVSFEADGWTGARLGSSSNQGETSLLSRPRSRLSTNKTSGHSNEDVTKVWRGDKRRWLKPRIERQSVQRLSELGVSPSR
eukprot:5478362-Pleurochrysis_carterae.AAC.1